MVDITPEEVMARKRAERDAANLTQFDHDLIGGTVRLEIPFRDRYKLRQAINLIRGWIDLAEQYTRRDDLPERAVLLHLREQASVTNKRIKQLHGAGRPKKIVED